MAFADFEVRGWMVVDEMTVFRHTIALNDENAGPVLAEAWIVFSHLYDEGVQEYYIPATFRGRPLIEAAWVAHLTGRMVNVHLRYTLQPLTIEVLSITSPGGR